MALFPRKEGAREREGARRPGERKKEGEGEIELSVVNCRVSEELCASQRAMGSSVSDGCCNFRLSGVHV